MKEKGRGGGKLAAHILAFIGVTLLLLALALTAAVYIATKGPSETARANVYEWADERGLGAIAGLFLSAEEKTAILNPASGQDETPEVSDTPMIIVSDEALPGASETTEESAAPETSEEPETSTAPEESPAASDNGEEAAS